MSIFDKLKGLFGGKPPEKPANDDGDAVPAPEESAGEEDGDAGAPSRAREVEDEADDDAPRRRTTPAEDRRIEGEARALFDGGDAKGGIALLDAQAILFARHERPEGGGEQLPCLCRKCLVPEKDGAEAQGVAYVRDFVVARHRALFYWMPKDLVDDAKRVRSSMRASIRHRLSPHGKDPKVVERRNPFTGQMQTFMEPAPRRGRQNPFGSSSS
jgi:hypothetical protein